MEDFGVKRSLGATLLGGPVLEDTIVQVAVKGMLYWQDNQFRG